LKCTLFRFFRIVVCIALYSYDSDLNASYQQWTTHYQMAAVPERPYKPKDKANAEVGVQIVERWILARLRHHTFFSLTQSNSSSSVPALSEPTLFFILWSLSSVISVNTQALSTQARREAKSNQNAGVGGSSSPVATFKKNPPGN
jgi:hypothetical protein